MKFTSNSYLTYLLLVSFFILFLLPSHAQIVRLSAGAGAMSFYDFHKNSDYSYANYRTGGHQFVKFDLSNVFSKQTPLNFYITLDRSSGHIQTSGSSFMFCGVGDYSYNAKTLDTKVNIYRMGVGVVPLTARLYKDLMWRGGLEFSSVIRSEYQSGDNRGFVALSTHNDPLSQNDVEMVNDFGLGLAMELELGKFSFGNNLLLHPVYNVSFSLLDEIDTGYTTRSVRQSLGLALRWNTISVNK